MTVVDATKIVEPRDADEALAYFLCYAHEDDTIALHTEWCRTQIANCFDCTCTPTTLKLGAKA